MSDSRGVESLIRWVRAGYVRLPRKPFPVGTNAAKHPTAAGFQEPLATLASYDNGDGH